MGERWTDGKVNARFGFDVEHQKHTMGERWMDGKVNARFGLMRNIKTYDGGALDGREGQCKIRF